MASLVASLSIATQSSISFPASHSLSRFNPKSGLTIISSNLGLKAPRRSDPSSSPQCLPRLAFASSDRRSKIRASAASPSLPPTNGGEEDDGIVVASSVSVEKAEGSGDEGEEGRKGGIDGDQNGAIVAELKQSLVDNLTGTNRGLKASSEVRAEIVELIAQLEAKNPTPAPTEALPLLNGKWILAYTSFSELFPLLAAGSLPLVKVGEISQFIDSDALTVENSVTFTGPLASTSFSTSASFEIRSPKRVQIKFEEGVIGTPQLTDSIEIPENIQLLGQNIDLTPAQGLLKSLQEAASSVAKTISGQPPLKFPIRTDRAQSWLLTTYLDKDLRISRGDGGSIFVLVKEDSPLLEDL